MIVGVADQEIENHQIPQLQLVDNRISRIAPQQVEHPRQIMVVRPLVFIRRGNAEGLSEILLMEALGHRGPFDGGRRTGEAPVVAARREEHVLIPAEADVDDKALGHGDAEMLSRGQRQLLVGHDAVEADVTLFDDVGTRRVALRQKPLAGIGIVVEADLAGGAGQRQMGFGDELSRDRHALVGEVADLFHRKLFVGRARCRLVGVADGDRAETFPPQHFEQGEVIVGVDVHPGSDRTAREALGQQPLEIVSGAFRRKRVFLKGQVKGNRPGIFPGEVIRRVLKLGQRRVGVRQGAD